jgi:hypothetical protein
MMGCRLSCDREPVARGTDARCDLPHCDYASAIRYVNRDLVRMLANIVPRAAGRENPEGGSRAPTQWRHSGWAWRSAPDGTSCRARTYSN